VRVRVGEDGSDYVCDICRSSGIGFAVPERQFDGVSIANAWSGEVENEIIREDRRPDRDDRQSGRRKRLLAKPALPLLRTWRGVVNAGNLGHVDQRFHADFRGDCSHGRACLQLAGGHGHAEEDSPNAADNAIHVGWFEQVPTPPQRRQPARPQPARLRGKP